MAKIKRKISKRRTKTRRNCIPCNPSMRGLRRINPDRKTTSIYNLKIINKSDLLSLFHGEKRNEIKIILDEFDFEYGSFATNLSDFALFRIDELFLEYPYILDNMKQFGITGDVYLNLG